VNDELTRRLAARARYLRDLRKIRNNTEPGSRRQRHRAHVRHRHYQRELRQIAGTGCLFVLMMGRVIEW